MKNNNKTPKGVRVCRWEPSGQLIQGVCDHQDKNCTSGTWFSDQELTERDKEMRRQGFEDIEPSEFVAVLKGFRQACKELAKEKDPIRWQALEGACDLIIRTFAEFAEDYEASLTSEQGEND